MLSYSSPLLFSSQPDDSRKGESYPPGFGSDIRRAGSAGVMTTRAAASQSTTRCVCCCNVLYPLQYPVPTLQQYSSDGGILVSCSVVGADRLYCCIALFGCRPVAPLLIELHLCTVVHGGICSAFPGMMAPEVLSTVEVFGPRYASYLLCLNAVHVVC